MKTMTSRERLLTALAGGLPDRVPASIHEWQPFHLNTHLDGLTDLEAFRRFGLDAMLWRVPLCPLDDCSWRVETQEAPAAPGERRLRVTITTPGGQLEKLVAEDPVGRWDVTHLIKRHEDIDLIQKYLPVPKLNKKAVQRDREALGQDGIMRGYVFGEQGGCWQDAVCLVGTQELILEAADHPDWVHELLNVLWQKKARFIEESLDGVPYDLIETGGGAASSTVISPTYFRQFCLPYDRLMHDALHSIGHKVVYHTCGGMMPILELIVENGCDACETLTPAAMGGDARPRELKQRIGKRVALIGGLDQHSVLEIGTLEQIRQHVREAFECYGPAGGYIMTPSDHFFHAPPENLEVYAEAVRGCRY
jgi:uroporphyrinogen-III decarboxylase